MKYILPLLLLLGIIGYTQLRPQTAPTPDPPGSYPADHIIRITAKLEFDGKPVVVDELITCLAEGAGGSTSGRQFLSFRPNRIRVAVDTLDGGMIMFSTRRSFCYVYAKTWGDYDEELTVPVGWTPMLTWLDHRDTREVNEGIRYVSETALNAENGRLKIIENFEITIPEHPFSDALLAEAEAQAIKHDYCLGLPDDCKYFGAYPYMIAIPEEMWRYPDPKFLRISIHANRDTDPQPLIDYLNALGEGEGILAIQFNKYSTNPDLIVPEEAERMIWGLSYGRFPDRRNMEDLGIPKSDVDRFGLLMSEAAAGRYERQPLDLNRRDDSIPWRCEEGYLVPDFDNPGIKYVYGQSAGCAHPSVNQGLIWPGVGIVENWERFYGAYLFDYETKTLWVSH